MSKGKRANQVTPAEPTTPSDPFSARLREARVDLRKMSQNELAAVTKMPSTSIAHFEGGSRKPSFDNLRALATGLDVSADYLMGRVDEPGLPDAGEDPLYRYFSGISYKDRPLAVNFLKMLAERDQDDA